MVRDRAMVIMESLQETTIALSNGTIDDIGIGLCFTSLLTYFVSLEAHCKLEILNLFLCHDYEGYY